MLAPKRWLKYAALVVFVTTLSLYLILYQNTESISRLPPSTAAWTGSPTDGPESAGSKDVPPGSSPAKTDDGHPISDLIESAYASFAELLGKRSWSLSQASARYRERRGRHPPPGFDKWFEAAQSNNAIIVEEFFDRVYHDINPFWGVDPLEMRRRAHMVEPVIRVRDGKIAHLEGDDKNLAGNERVVLWSKLVEEMLPHLPDLDMPINVFDESRMLVPWDNITEYIAKEQDARAQGILPPAETTAKYTAYSDTDLDSERYNPSWVDDKTDMWDYVARACPPDSPGRQQKSLETATGSIDDLFPTSPMPFTKDGFIANFTQAQDPCLQPHLRGMHGTFVESFSMAVSTEDLFPIFSGSKITANNDILIPGAMYLSDQVRYSGGADYGGPWAAKKTGLVWRGTASGGRNQEDNWWHYQRHRFVQMTNGSAVARAEASGDDAEESGPTTFNLRAAGTYDVPAQREARLGAWVDGWSDVGFNRLDCWPERHNWLGRLKVDCPYTDPFFALVGSKSMQEQYNTKFLPDVDGNSYSARWRGFLLSTSCPLKATVYAEWHDDRMVPWLHFVPFDNTFMDIYAVMDYFLSGHDAQAQRIAEEGHDWAQKVLRREDMMLYVWRLLLEYGRVMDPNRDTLGFVDDLSGTPS
ncbi:Uu.00g051880.m01.CDS01 [Anthostomella pinea]|uniref:Uu.00g051880.m01.CDS01 n=1 Tax=Anthostomella pinea TaxID=933095 RepID=A0AAI8VW70_9PEZI|nr:Uu.00g051880.m01.CDS01 [Anthostomella pinea]